MDKYFYQDAANHIRKNYDNIVNKEIFDLHFISRQEEYIFSIPLYNLAAHYTFSVSRVSDNKRVADGEVGAQCADEKKIRFYHGYKILYESNL